MTGGGGMQGQSHEFQNKWIVWRGAWKEIWGIDSELRICLKFNVEICDFCYTVTLRQFCQP